LASRACASYGIVPASFMSDPADIYRASLARTSVVSLLRPANISSGGIAHAFNHFNIDSFLFFRHNNRASLVKVFVAVDIA
ncbi:MAG: hypothetical protein LBG12_06330, partial [Synergistaceae bacterium]|nr:hypothetical protein [Synergistaceae bacterium]